MGFTYRSRKITTRVACVSLVFFLLTAFIFKIQGGTCHKSGFGEITVNQSNEFAQIIFTNNDKSETVQNTVPIKQLLDTGFIGIIIGCVLSAFLRFFGINRSKFFSERRYTLVSLCIRMDE